MNLFLPLQNHPEYLIKRKHSPLQNTTITAILINKICISNISFHIYVVPIMLFYYAVLLYSSFEVPVMLCTQAALVVYHTGPLLAISIFRPAPMSAPCLLPCLHPLSAAFIPVPILYSSYHQNSLITTVCNSLIVSHLNSFYRRLPSVTRFLPTEHAPNPRAAVISVYDTNPVNAFSRRMYLHIDCLFRFPLCFFPCTSISMDSARHLSIIPHFFCSNILSSMIIHHAINFKSNTMALLPAPQAPPQPPFANTCLMKAACFLSTPCIGLLICSAPSNLSLYSFRDSSFSRKIR